MAPMYIETVPNRNSPPAVLLREGWREGNKTHKRTLANLSHWPQQKIETFRRLLQDEPLVSPQDLLSTHQTLPHGRRSHPAGHPQTPTGFHPRRQALSRARFGPGHDRPTLARSRFEIGHHASVA